MDFLAGGVGVAGGCVAFKIQSTAFVSGSKGSSLLHNAKCIQFISKNPQSLKSFLVPKSRFMAVSTLGSETV